MLPVERTGSISCKQLKKTILLVAELFVVVDNITEKCVCIVEKMHIRKQEKECLTHKTLEFLSTKNIYKKYNSCRDSVTQRINGSREP